MGKTFEEQKEECKERAIAALRTEGGAAYLHCKELPEQPLCHEKACPKLAEQPPKAGAPARDEERVAWLYGRLGDALTQRDDARTDRDRLQRELGEVKRQLKNYKQGYERFLAENRQMKDKLDRVRQVLEG